MKQKIQVSFDINIDYPTIEENKKVIKCTKQWAKEWIEGTEWSDFVPLFYDPEDEQEFNYPLKAKFIVRASLDNKCFMKQKWSENEIDIGLNSSAPASSLKQKKK